MTSERAISKSLIRFTLAIVLIPGFVSLVSPRAFAQGKDGFTYNGIVYTSWWYDEYGNYADPPLATGAATTSSDQLALTKANYASILVTQYVQTGASTAIAPLTQKTPLDDQVVFAIQTFHNLGLKVFLKPHVDCNCSTWRGAFAPSDPAAWFASFQTFILHYAQMAQANNVEGMVIGTEYKTLSGSAYQSYWANIIGQIRKVYTGQLAYGANATGAGDEFTTVSFWSLVDLIGVDGYFGLTTQTDPSVSQLVSAWTNSPQNGGFNALAAIQNLHSTYNKPVIFTELGYESTAGTNSQPWNSGLSNGYDPTEQSNCYEAFFEVFSQQNSWMKGVFWWDWMVPAPSATDTGYSPNGKPAGTTELPMWFGGSATPSFRISPSAASLTVAQNGSGTDTITVTDAGGFSGSVTLSASGLPSGVTASFGTNPTTGSSVLTLKASATAAAGTSTVTINGTSGSLTATTTIALTVTGGGTCTPTAITPYLQVNGAAWQQTATATVASGSTVNLGPQPMTGTWSWTGPNGFTSATREIDGIPLSTGANSYVATYTNAAACKSTQTFSITVSGGATPSFTLSASAPTLSIAQGSSGTDTITVTDAGGFTGSVTLAVSGLPTGVTAALGTNPTTGTSVLTLTASATATTGASTVTIKGTSGTLSASTTVTLTVTTGGGTGGFACHVGYSISNQWAGGFGAALTIGNTGTTAISNWTLTWTFANGQTITQLWNANETQSGANVTVTNLSYNGSIPAGGSVTSVGFNGTWNNVTNAVPTNFAINGTACK